MANYSMKKAGKEVGPASVYAEPHNMKGQKLKISNLDKPKTSGIKIRGTGAATKGVMARGPMA